MVNISSSSSSSRIDTPGQKNMMWKLALLILTMTFIFMYSGEFGPGNLRGGSDVKLVIVDDDEAMIASTSRTRQLLQNQNSARRLLPLKSRGFNDPKSVELRHNQQLIMVDNNEEDATPPLPSDTLLGSKLELMLTEIPDSLPWKPVPQNEREQTPTCSNSSSRCCIGQCRKPRVKIMEGTQEFDDLFLKPDMEGLVSMTGLLEFLHFFVEQKRLERRVSLMGNDENTNSANEGMLPDVIDSQQQQPPPPITDTDDIYPWCTLWFIGASTTQDQARAAVCKLSSLGYEITRGGLDDLNFCELTSNVSQHCPRMRVRSVYSTHFLVNDYQSEDEAGVVIYSWGVHANSLRVFARFMKETFQPLYDDFQSIDTHPGRYAFMWREHEPQHFAAPGGTYDGKLTTCQDTGVYNNFRNEEVHRYFKVTGLVEKIPIIKSYDALKPLYMFHYGGDCTHYCYSPWRFDLTWHGVALGLQQYYYPTPLFETTTTAADWSEKG